MGPGATVDPIRWKGATATVSSRSGGAQDDGPGGSHGADTSPGGPGGPGAGMGDIGLCDFDSLDCCGW